jgi:hypothetical protein
MLQKLIFFMTFKEYGCLYPKVEAPKPPKKLLPKELTLVMPK